MSEDKKPIKGTPKPKIEKSIPVKEGFGESAKQQDDLRKGSEIPPKPPKPPKE